jgi:hypothetical protein
MYKLCIYPSSRKYVLHDMLPLIRFILKKDGKLTPPSGPDSSIFPLVGSPIWNSRMVECPLDVLQWAEELYQVDARWVLSYRPSPIGSIH